uniref:Uncharacterized protein n=1 Tax=Timema cristinae TaxID=61476 RepID=A0A7R9DBG9_TIMCR|nr:unnamed protein product [Timema cristinae]
MAPLEPGARGGCAPPPPSPCYGPNEIDEVSVLPRKNSQDLAQFPALLTYKVLELKRGLNYLHALSSSSSELLEESEGNLERELAKWAGVMEQYGLDMNVEKSKIRKVARNTNPAKNVTINGKEPEKEEDYCKR